MSKFTYTPENEKEFERIAKRYPRIDSMMLPALWLVQEQEGWISPEAMIYVADKLGTTPVRVYEVVTFYTMFHRKPIGKHHIEICKTLSCMLCGAGDVKNQLKDMLGIEPGQTTEDGMFTISEVECMGACGGAPMISLNETYHENLDKESLSKIIEECKKC